ncbi:universal stress protein [Halosegnis longus]|uniref:Universal stress protein n=1 Tax=Halosegnis longus TaxID=2216012 RepID=A0AAJ4UW57_9EURY|nr:universal stress protein [Halosegnis longus]RNJ26737.1 universal stress protein [Salella cibi]
MHYFVAFDGTRLSEEAVRRVRSMAHATDDITVATAIPDGDEEFARERGWLAEDDPFEMEAVVRSAREEALSLASAAEFDALRVGHHAPSGAIGSRLRRLVRDIDPEVVVVGSENAGHQMDAVGSVASSVIGGDSYDVLVVRHVRE